MAGRPRILREKKTVELMIALYCRKQHKGKHQLCPECQELAKYAALRLGKCPFSYEKPVCARCAVHCYKPEMRDKIRTIMRYAGPRMIFSHPVLAIWHTVDGRRNKPVSKKHR